MERSRQRSAESLYAVRFLQFQDANLATLPEGSRLRRLVETISAEIADHVAMPPVGEAPAAGSLDDAMREIAARVREANGEIWLPPSVEQWETIGAGMPFTREALADAAAQAARDMLPNSDGRPKQVIAAGMTAYGMKAGALAQSWRR